MKYLIIALSILIGFNVNAQTTAIPDANFEQALIDLGYDTGVPDGLILTTNIDTITNLVIGWSNINDLTGIEDFTSLNALVCTSNHLTSLDLSQNTLLTILYCESNQLTSLKVTQNVALIYLNCKSNQLTSLNVTQNISLKYLYCDNNQLNNLNLKQNLALTSLNCSYNLLTSLNIVQNTTLGILYCNNNQLGCLNVKNGNNHNIFPFKAANNPNLTCIGVDNPAWSTTNWTVSNNNIDPQSSFSTNCSNPCFVGIEENSFTSLSIYPNPTTGNINIDLGEVRQDLKTTLTNSLGQVLLNKDFAFTNYINLDLNYPKGLYFLSLETQGEVVVKKIVIE